MWIYLRVSVKNSIIKNRFMLKYLVVILSDNSVSYCHYQNTDKSKMIGLDALRKGILFAMKNDLRIQYILPCNDLPEEYHKLIDSMFHDSIGPLEQMRISDVVVINGFNILKSSENRFDSGKRYILRTDIQSFMENYENLKELFANDININIVFTDAESFTDEKIISYRNALADLALSIKDAILTGHNINTNLLTDRIALDEMNNCGAGDTSITLAPDGRFYPCPAFYYSQIQFGEIGNVEDGLDIKNHKLYTLEGSPLCKRCDAYHCKRCVWLNKCLTCEVNVPSRQQCVMAHIERNVSRNLLDEFHKLDLLNEKEIVSINYLDPFDVYQEI